MESALAVLRADVNLVLAQETHMLVTIFLEADRHALGLSNCNQLNISGHIGLIMLWLTQLFALAPPMPAPPQDFGPPPEDLGPPPGLVWC